MIQDRKPKDTSKTLQKIDSLLVLIKAVLGITLIVGLFFGLYWLFKIIFTHS